MNEGSKEIRDKANAIDEHMNLKKGQGNSEGDLKTQLQIEGKHEGERRKSSHGKNPKIQ